MPVLEVGQRENHFYPPRILGRSFVCRKGRLLDCEVASVIPTRLWRRRPRPSSSESARERQTASMPMVEPAAHAREREGAGGGMTGREQINGDEEEERAGKRGSAMPAQMPSEIQDKEGAAACEYSATAGS